MKHVYCLKIFGWRFYLANCRMKKMAPSDAARHHRFYAAALKARKKRLFAKSDTCDICGRKMSIENLQMHHILPYAEFPQYGTNPANLEMVCDECHHTIHQNPYVNLQRMEQKAQEMGFCLTEYFNKNNLNG